MVQINADVSTRERVAVAVLERGPVTAAALAGVLGLTPAAVRRHLDAMLAEGLVDIRTAHGTRGRGRPARCFVLTDAGHAAMTTTYDDLAVSALRFMAAEHGQPAVDAFARARVADLEARYAPRVAEAGSGTPERVEALARALSDDGYAASSRPVGHGAETAATQLCQGHCPVQHVAAEFPELCEAETQAFSRLLGVHVQRLATLAHGEHVCTTHVPNDTTHVPTERQDRSTGGSTRQHARNDTVTTSAGASLMTRRTHR